MYIMINLKKIIIISVYIGKEFPWYFPFFLKTCKFNNSIDYLFVTNINIEKFNLPKNIKAINLSLSDFCIMASSKLGFKIIINNLYKLCDFKPSYGLIFQDYIHNYDFWGHSDIDLVYGNIRGFMTHEVLSNNEIISIRSEYISGFFALYKNTNKINNLFQESEDYRIVFQTPNYLGFDECSLKCEELLQGNSINKFNETYKSMTHIVKILENKDKIRAYFDLHVVESTPGNLLWDRGNLYYKNIFEIMLYHLVSFKVHPQLVIPKWKKIPNKFYINEFFFTK